jgi:hypothetical protein
VGLGVFAVLALALLGGVTAFTAASAARPRALLAIFNGEGAPALNGEGAPALNGDPLLDLARAGQEKISTAATYLDSRAKDLQRLDDDL